MAPEPIHGFRSFVTHHCVTGSLRHVYEFAGHPISEEMLLGLGAGVGFVYWHMKGAPPFLGGRANTGRPGEEGLEKAAGRRAGVVVESFRTASAKKAESALLERLADGQPTMLQVDMGYLPYFDFPVEYHFGGHVVVAAGYDSASGEVLIADRDADLHPVSLAAIRAARGSKHKPFPPEHAWWAFDFAGFHEPTADDTVAAIRESATAMLEPPIANLGVKGIRKAATAIRAWPRDLAPDELRAALFNGYIFVDAAGGTGGGIFRYMYGRFLAEAAGVVGDARLASVGERFREIGDRWQTVALAMKSAGESDDPAAGIPAAVAPLADIADREEEAWRQLLDATAP
jgi:hypothetical protein